MTEAWVTVSAGEVQTGDRLRLASGTELTVSRIETAFLGYDDLICFVEDSEAQWLAQAVRSKSDIEIRR
jgi:hypothetical protein